MPPCPLSHGVAWFYDCFISVPTLLIILYSPYICYLSFDLFQLCHSIESDYILCFHFNPYSLNFGFGFKSLDIFGTKDLIFFFNFILWLKLIIYLIFISAFILLIFYFNPFIFFYISGIISIFAHVSALCFGFLFLLFSFVEIIFFEKFSFKILVCVYDHLKNDISVFFSLCHFF